MAKKKSINEKLKEAVQASIAQAEPESQIPKCTAKREKEVTVYKLWCHERRTLDHSKYPNARSKPVENSPMFATFREADKEVLKREKDDKEYIYWGRMCTVKESEVPKSILKKLKERGWGC